jgi:hypothetical protein
MIPAVVLIRGTRGAVGVIIAMNDTVVRRGGGRSARRSTDTPGPARPRVMVRATTDAATARRARAGRGHARSDDVDVAGCCRGRTACSLGANQEEVVGRVSPRRFPRVVAIPVAVPTFMAVVAPTVAM